MSLVTQGGNGRRPVAQCHYLRAWRSPSWCRNPGWWR
jgi:hypothetical protein